jgi:hypothetical protein
MAFGGVAARGMHHATLGAVWPPASTGSAVSVKIYRVIRALTGQCGRELASIVLSNVLRPRTETAECAQKDGTPCPAAIPRR